MRYSSIFALVLIIFEGHLALADEYRLKFIPNSAQADSKAAKSDLTWDASKETQEPVIQIRENTQKETPYFVKLHGSVLDKTKSFLFEMLPIVIGNDGKFSIEVSIDSERREFTVSEVDSDGRLISKSSELQFPQWNEFLAGQKPEQKTKKKLSFQAGIGLGAVTYAQTDITTATNINFNELSTSLQGAGRYQWKDNLAFAADFAFTALPIAIGPTGNTIRLLNLGAQVATLLPILHAPWNLELLASYSFKTSFRSQSTFGYTNVQGVSIYPRIEWAFADQKKISALVKFMPISNGGFTFLSLNNYDLSFQVGYQGLKILNHGIELALGCNLLYLNYNGGSTGSIQVGSYQIDANYLF